MFRGKNLSKYVQKLYLLLTLFISSNANSKNTIAVNKAFNPEADPDPNQRGGRGGGINYIRGGRDYIRGRGRGGRSYLRGGSCPPLGSATDST